MAENFLNWLIQESESSELLDRICLSYKEKSGRNNDKEFLGAYHGIKIYAINRRSLELEKPEWRTYIGSHHWGKQTDYIPEDEIWISKDLDDSKFRKVLNHELIEREAMRALEEERGMDPQEAWFMAHMWVKQVGF